MKTPNLDSRQPTLYHLDTIAGVFCMLPSTFESALERHGILVVQRFSEGRRHWKVRQPSELAICFGAVRMTEDRGDCLVEPAEPETPWWSARPLTREDLYPKPSKYWSWDLERTVELAAQRGLFPESCGGTFIDLERVYYGLRSEASDAEYHVSDTENAKDGLGRNSELLVAVSRAHECCERLVAILEGDGGNKACELTQLEATVIKALDLYDAGGYTSAVARQLAGHLRRVARLGEQLGRFWIMPEYFRWAKRPKQAPRVRPKDRRPRRGPF